MAEKFNVKVAEAFSGLGKITGKNKWRARILKVGMGGTGNYLEEGLKISGPLAFPPGTKVNFDHPTEDEKWERPVGSVQTLAGALISTPAFEMDEDGGGLYSDIEFSQESAPFIEQFHEILGLSIRATGYGTEYTDTGLPIIEGLIPSPLNTVDVVTVGGAGGKLVKLLESYTEKHDKLNLNETIRKGSGVTPEEITALIKGMKDELIAVLKPEPAQTEAPEASEISEALITAKLPKSARDKVYDAVKSGSPLQEAISKEQAYIKELSEAFKADVAAQGVVGGGSTSDMDFIVGGWAN